MNVSVRYTAEEFAVELPAAEYAARFRDAERIAAYCRRCPNYGRSWGCPPFAKDPAEEWLRYGTALLVAAKITPCEEGLPSPRPGGCSAPNAYGSKGGSSRWSAATEDGHSPTSEAASTAPKEAAPGRKGSPAAIPTG